MEKKDLPQYLLGYNATRNLLRQLRVKHGYTVKEILALTDVNSIGQVYRWEAYQPSGKGSLPSVENLFRLSQLYGVKMQDLLVGEANGYAI